MGRGSTTGASNGLMRPDDFPQDDGTPHHGTRLAEDLSFVAMYHDSAQLSSSGLP